MQQENNAKFCNKNIKITASGGRYYSYAHHISGIPALSRLFIQNLSSDDIYSAELKVSDTAGLFQAFNKKIAKLPHGMTVQADTSQLSLSPQKLLHADEPYDTEVVISLNIEGMTERHECFSQIKITILPFDSFCGTDSLPELICAHITPDRGELSSLHSSTLSILRSWKIANAGGYSEDKSHVRFIAAAAYGAVMQAVPKPLPGAALWEKPFAVRSIEDILSAGSASVAEAAVLYCALLESFSLNPVICAGEDYTLCGVWLTDNCFNEGAGDEITLIRKYSEPDINDIAIVDMAHIIGGSAGGFETAARSAESILEKGSGMLSLIDIKRCRISRFMPLPRRIKKGKGYAGLIDEPHSAPSMPRELKKPVRTLRTRPILSREKQWERRLLDLTLRNRLLSTQPGKNALHVMFSQPGQIISGIMGGEVFSVTDMPKEGFAKLKDVPDFGGASALMPISELLSLELRNKRICTFSEPKQLSQALSALHKKDRLSFEESGTGTVYLAAGFLKWSFAGEGQNFKYAPLLLLQVSLQKSASGRGYSIKAREDECHFNTTLLEFLKQEFNIELRGLDELSLGHDDIESVLAAVKRRILPMKGWEVTPDVYIASYSFSRFLMWNDIRHNMDEFRKNPIIDALIKGSADAKDFKKVSQQSPDEKRGKKIMLPISADYSQYSAVAASASGHSFVLHGPPGTGKSQTITNIIANAIGSSRRVLFVAEKMAALSVVGRRLSAIGLGDFCMELHSGATPKTEIAQKILQTAQLSAAAGGQESRADELWELKDQIRLPKEALHKKRSLGLSVYEMITEYKKYERAPDVLEIDGSFLESINPDKFKKYRELLSELIFVVRDVGQIYRSPFEGIGESRASGDYISRVKTAALVLSEQARHLKVYANLCFDKFQNSAGQLSQQKLEILSSLCAMLTAKNSPYAPLFENNSVSDTAAALNEFTQLYKVYTESEKQYNAQYKHTIELPASPEFLLEELEKYKDSYKKSRALRSFSKKIERARTTPLQEPADMAAIMKQAADFYIIKNRMAFAGDAISKLLSGGRQERVDYNKVADIILKISSLYDIAKSLFVRYDPVSFNKMLKDIYSEFPSVILTSYLQAFEAFEEAQQRFMRLLKIKQWDNAADADYLDYVSGRAGAVLANIDMLPAWLRFNKISEKLTAAGLSFAIAPLKDSKVSPEQMINCFMKKTYLSFIDREISQDAELSALLPPVMQQRITKLKELAQQHADFAAESVYHKAAMRLPKPGVSGELAQQMAILHRAVKSNMRGITIRQLFKEIPDLVSVTMPCLLMSPSSVAQYLQPQAGMFDLVIFDEASQMPTSEAVGCIARANQAIIVGDPKQLPPTSFFTSDYVDEDNLKNEDLESILDDALALGLPEKYLIWHYRSKHESLIAFSNAMYYQNKLRTFPSPDAMTAKVSLKMVPGGVYDRGASKQNAAEADAVVAEVIRRLKSRTRQSIGIITFGIAQQSLIESKLSLQVARHRLEDIAYDTDEPVFVKNLENVQGDERDFILLSVCYGPDKRGRVSLNFGPLNQSGGWRRLNVAASRAKEEMQVYSSMTPDMIDLSKNSSRGAAGIKSLLEFAEGGRSALAVRAEYVSAEQPELGQYIAKDLTAAGLKCRHGLGVSGFKIDVAVCDPKDPQKFVLAIICDNTTSYSTRSIHDTEVLQINMLKRLGWNVMRVYALSYYANPRREIRKIKLAIAKLGGSVQKKSANKFVTEYNLADIPSMDVLSAYVTDGSNDAEIIQRLRLIAAAEQPLSSAAIIKRCLSSYGIIRSGGTVRIAMQRLLAQSGLYSEEIGGQLYYRSDNSVLDCMAYRVDSTGKLRRSVSEITPYEIVAAARYVLGERISLAKDQLIKQIAACFLYSRISTELSAAIYAGIAYGEQRGMLFISINDTVTLA